MLEIIIVFVVILSLNYLNYKGNSRNFMSFSTSVQGLHNTYICPWTYLCVSSIKKKKFLYSSDFSIYLLKWDPPPI